MVPHNGPNNGEVKPASRMLDSVIMTDVPKIG